VLGKPNNNLLFSAHIVEINGLDFVFGTIGTVEQSSRQYTSEIDNASGEIIAENRDFGTRLQDRRFQAQLLHTPPQINYSFSTYMMENI
jgi:hypothetical protein